MLPVAFIGRLPLVFSITLSAVIEPDNTRVEPVAAPNAGVTNVGEVARTLFPVPVFVTETRFLEASVASADEAVREDSWREVPVAAPRTGVTRVGDVARTLFPEPVFVTETRFLEASVASADEAVREDSWREVPVAAPRTGVTRVGDVARTLFPEPVFVTETRFFEASVATAEDAVKPDNWSEVPKAAPIFGVVNVGEVCKTTAPEPVEEVIEILGVEPPEEESGDEAVTDVIVPMVGVVHV
jgi:hypothetical protein